MYRSASELPAGRDGQIPHRVERRKLTALVYAQLPAVATLRGTTSSTPGSAAALGRSRHRPRLAQQHREQRRPRFWTAAVSYASAVRAVSATATCAASTVQGSNPGLTTLPHVERQRRDGNGGRRRGCGVLQETGATRQQIEQQSHAGPFAGPKPESMMVSGGARRSDQQAHQRRLEQARRFLPSWSCEFDSRHPLRASFLVNWDFQCAELFEQPDDKNIQAGHAVFHDHHRAMYRSALSGLLLCR